MVAAEVVCAKAAAAEAQTKKDPGQLHHNGLENTTAGQPHSQNPRAATVCPAATASLRPHFMMKLGPWGGFLYLGPIAC